MARKTNKTDHVLNLLSSGKKASTGKEEKDTPPVDLRRKTSEQDSSDVPDAGPQKEINVKAAASEVYAELQSEQQQVRTAVEVQPQETHQPKVVVEKQQVRETPEVSVVRPAVDEKAIADAVKDSLESELNAYLQEKEAAEAESELTVAFPRAEEKSASFGINISELLEETTEEPGKEPVEAPVPEEPKSESAAPLARQQETVSEAELEARESERTTEESEPSKPQQEAISGSRPEITPGQMEAAVEKEPEPESMPSIEEGGRQETEVPQMKNAESIEPSEQKPIEPKAAKPAEPVPPQPEAAAEEPKKTEAAAKAAAESAERGEDMPSPEGNAPLQEEAVEAAASKQDSAQQPKEKDFVMVNVMEYLVREQVPQYVRQFGHCDCDRCIEDTIALTLTHLPAKYVVVNKDTVSPLLNFYEKRYAGQLIVEITKSTMIVNNSPHHE